MALEVLGQDIKNESFCETRQRRVKFGVGLRKLREVLSPAKCWRLNILDSRFRGNDERDPSLRSGRQTRPFAEFTLSEANGLRVTTANTTTLRMTNANATTLRITPMR
jgi:hypothetical protein